MRTQKRTKSLLILVTTLIVLGVVVFAVSETTSNDAAYFPETNQFVREPFLAYFEQNGGIDTFGYPLTPAYETDESTLVQTFQNMQLARTVRGVMPSPIGITLALGDITTGSNVASEFQDFYTEADHAALLGLPIAPAIDTEGALVQDFENARLIREEGEAPRLAQLGAMYARIYPAPEFSGQANLNLVLTPTSVVLKPSVTIDRPSLVSGQEQTIYVSVKDQAGAPLENVDVLAVLTLDDALAEVEFTPTDPDGMTSATFLPPPVNPGTQVLIEVHLLLGDTFKTVQLTYTQWY